MSTHQASVIMWDKFDILVARTGNGLQVVKDFIDYFKKRAAIEATYAKNLGDLAKELPGAGVFTKKPAVADESKTLKNALLSGQTANSAISSHLVEFHTKLTNEVIKPLENFVKTKENERKKLVTDGQKFNKTVADAKQAVAKALDTYTRLNKDSDAARDALEKIPSTDTKKYPAAEKKAKEFEEKVKNAETAYQTGVDKFNESQNKSFSSDMPAVLDGLQQLEQDRFNELKSALVKYYELLATFPPFFNDRLTDMSKTINDDLSWDEDWSEYADSNKSANEKPETMEFKAYEGKYSAAKEEKKEEKKEEPKKEEKKTEVKKEEKKEEPKKEEKKTEVKKEEPKKEEKKPEAKKEEPKKEEKKAEPEAKKEEPKEEEEKKEEKDEPVVEKKSKDEEDIFG